MTTRMMQWCGRMAIFLYGMMAYAGFLAILVYTIGFLGNWVVPKSIDSGEPGPLATAMMVNTLLLGLFVMQHTVMARPRFKRWMARFMPKPMERSTFVLATLCCFMLLFWQWRPMPLVLWNIEHAMARSMMIMASIVGWGVVLMSSFMVNHFDLFGVRQVVLHLMGREYQPLEFQVAGLYRWMRHPLMTGFMMAFWATPTMTMGHMFFAIMVTGYILMGTWFEERDLVAHFGDRYRQYQRSVPSFLPLPRWPAVSRPLRVES